MPIADWILLASFLSCVPLANWMIGHIGVARSGGVELIFVAPGVAAPSGVVVVGLVFVLRDLVQRRLGKGWAAGVIACGGLVSLAVAPAALALASVASYVVSEVMDMLVFTAVVRRGLFVAVVCSAVVAAAIDSALFVRLAFGTSTFQIGQFIGKLEAVTAALPVVALARKYFS